MSNKYPDLTNTVFPNSVDTFITALNITAEDAPKVKAYMEAMQNGNISLASSIFASIDNASRKVLSAERLNQFSDSLTAMERFYRNDIKPYITEKQSEWQGIINEFTYKGDFSPTTQYAVNNYVSYSTTDGNFLYIAERVPPVGTLPTDTRYWRTFTVKGSRGAAGVGVSFIGEWSVYVQYNINNCVEYDGSLWIALQANQGSIPSKTNTNWQYITDFGVTPYAVASTRPSTVKDGDLWFKVVS